MKRKYKFDIGDYVKVNRKVIVDSDDNSNRVEFFKELNPPVFGKICGMKRKFLGIIKAGYNNIGPPEFEGNYLEVKASVLLYEIKEGMLNKPILAKEEDIKIIGSGRFYEALIMTGFDFPFIKQKNSWSEEQRKEMSKDSKNYPRDSKGRFCK